MDQIGTATGLGGIDVTQLPGVEAEIVDHRPKSARRIAGAEKVGKHKTSMLQDVENGRALELEALVGAVVELGRITDTPVPTIQAVYATVSLLARTLAGQGGRLRVQTA